MAEPSVIVPPTPTVKQGETIAPAAAPPQENPEISVERVESLLDKHFPMPKGMETPPTVTPEPAPATPAATEPVAPAAPDKPETPPAERKMPSFLEEALKPDPGQAPSAPSAPSAEEWPEEFPDQKASEETKTNWKKFRAEYKTLKEQLKARPAAAPADEATQVKLKSLETQNAEMQKSLSRFGVEQNADFQQNVMRPLHGAWNEATRIVKEAGKDPNDLARALTLQGKNQFEALDELFEGIPESAKAGVNDAIRAYRHFDGIRQNALRDAPKTFEHLRRKELERQYESLNQQKQEMVGLFEDTVKTLRDDGKVELLRHTDDPDSSWWNEQADGIIAASRSLYLENTDMKKMAVACVLAPMADAYRKLWMSERAQRLNTEKTLKDKFGAEPSLSSSGGNAGASIAPSDKLQADLKRPFKDVFLEKFHEAQAKAR